MLFSLCQTPPGVRFIDISDCIIVRHGNLGCIYIDLFQPAPLAFKMRFRISPMSPFMQIDFALISSGAKALL